MDPMRTLAITLALGLALTCFRASFAQQAPARTITATAATDQAQFDAILARAAKFLESQPTYSVTVESQWKTSRDDGGSHTYKLTAQRPSAFRVEVQTGNAERPELLCVSDGKQETTLLTTQNLYSRLPAASSGLQRNKLLAMSLAGSGVDVLMQPNLVQAVLSQVTSVKDLGTQTIDGAPLRGFSMQWAGNEVELWFTTQGDPLLKQFSRKTHVATGADSAFELHAVARFTWKLNQRLPADAFALRIPAEAKKVFDIYDALAGAEASPVGQPLPEAEVVRLDGNHEKLQTAGEKPATVLIFWATWCAPSVSDMPAVTEFIKGLSAQGIGCYAVNVGEPITEVRQFATKHSLQSTVVLDSTGQLSHQLQIADLPAAVVVDGEGKVRAVLHGQVSELKDGLTKELTALAPKRTGLR
jgi:peroxiredoxin